MNHHEQLPAELLEVEQALRDEHVAPGAQLESQVLGAVRQALDAQRRAGRWRFAACAAAVLLVGLHWSWPLATIEIWEPTVSGDDIERTALAIQEIAPELTEADALRQARLMAAGGSSGWSRRPIGRVLLPVGNRFEWE